MAAEIRKVQIFIRGIKERLLSTHRVQNLLQIALSPTVFEINDIFYSRQNSRWRPKFGKFKYFQRLQERILTTQRVQNMLQIALSRTVFEITDIFSFRQNSRWRPKFWKFKYFLRRQRENPYYPKGPKFAPNRSISNGFRDKRHFLFPPPKFKMAAEILKVQIFSEAIKRKFLARLRPSSEKLCCCLQWLTRRSHQRQEGWRRLDSERQ